MTLRSIETLKMVDVLFCEDTRITKQMLNRLEINKKLISFIIQSKTIHPNTELILRTEVEVFESEAKNNPLYLCQLLIILQQSSS